MDNIQILQDTLQTMHTGQYRHKGKTVALKLSQQEMQRCRVFLPEDVRHICSTRLPNRPPQPPCMFRCLNADTFATARKMAAERLNDGKPAASRILVHNFASPVHPGGGVRKGARAQEEQLCRTSTLLASLESREAEKYYRYNRGKDYFLNSDAMILSPDVEIIKDEYGRYLPETTVVSVLTCASPVLKSRRLSAEDMDLYFQTFRQRIFRLLVFAARMGYTDLVLGAWGCGAFGNDAKIVSDMFAAAFARKLGNGRKVEDCFCRVWFSVLSRKQFLYNYEEFCRNG